MHSSDITHEQARAATDAITLIKYCKQQAIYLSVATREPVVKWRDAEHLVATFIGDNEGADITTIAVVVIEMSSWLKSGREHLISSAGSYNGVYIMKGSILYSQRHMTMKAADHGITRDYSFAPYWIVIAKTREEFPVYDSESMAEFYNLYLARKKRGRNKDTELKSMVRFHC